MKVNYHCHSEYCGHAQGAVFDYVSEAVSQGLEILGMSDHAPFPDGFHGNGMSLDQLDSYLSEIEESAESFKGRITLYKSLEIEFLPEFYRNNDYYEWLLNKKKMDYLLLGEHFFRDRNGDFHNIYFSESSSEILEYAIACKEAMETGYFKMIAHPDIFAMNEKLSWDDNFDRALEMIIESAEKNKVVLEYNANGRRRGLKQFPEGKRYQYPHEKFWKAVSSTNIPVVVGSDCHNPSQMWDSEVEASHEYLKSIGIKPVEKFL